MICEHPECTGNHNDRKRATLCPRAHEAKLAHARQRYEAQTGFKRAQERMRLRRYFALKRVAERNTRLPKEA